MMAVAEEKEKGATKIQIYHTNKGAVFRPWKGTYGTDGTIISKNTNEKEEKTP